MLKCRLSRVAVNVSERVRALHTSSHWQLSSRRCYHELKEYCIVVRERNRKKMMKNVTRIGELSTIYTVIETEKKIQNVSFWRRVIAHIIPDDVVRLEEMREF